MLLRKWSRSSSEGSTLRSRAAVRVRSVTAREEEAAETRPRSLRGSRPCRRKPMSVAGMKQVRQGTRKNPGRSFGRGSVERLARDVETFGGLRRDLAKPVMWYLAPVCAEGQPTLRAAGTCSSSLRREPRWTRGTGQRERDGSCPGGAWKSTRVAATCSQVTAKLGSEYRVVAERHAGGVQANADATAQPQALQDTKTS